MSFWARFTTWGILALALPVLPVGTGCSDYSSLDDYACDPADPQPCEDADRECTEVASGAFYCVLVTVKMGCQADCGDGMICDPVICVTWPCPAQCIHIVPAEYPEGEARRGYEKYPEEFVIDELRSPRVAGTPWRRCR